MSRVKGLSTGDDPLFASTGIVPRRTLFRRLSGAARVTQISAPAGSGKTVLLRSWIGDAGLADSTAWVSVQAEERDTERFWITVADALRRTAAGSLLVRSLTVAPDLDGWSVVERLLEDLAPVEGRLWVVLDDMHELRSADALRQFELFLMRAPAGLRFLLSTRHDLRLGLHRLRLEGGLTELRGADIQFDADEARVLFEAAGIHLPEASLAQLVARTEGWAAGLRLAALSLAGHPDPERFAAEFSGTERTVAEYLLAEVLDGQPDEMRWLLLRTSLLERVSGPLADCLTGGREGSVPFRNWRRLTRSSPPSTPAGPGSGTTRCSPSSCGSSCAACSRARCRPCTRPPRGGSPSTDTPLRRPGTRKGRETGTRPPLCCPITG